MANPVEYFHESFREVKMGIPAHMVEPVREYVVSGRRTGDFLRAVLANQFHQAVKRADGINRNSLLEWTDVLCVLPCESWGSDEKVVAWIKGGGLLGRMQQEPPDE